MITDLKDNIIFLHGLSGSGKGELYRKLAEQYSSHGYDTVYVSSGALFREAFSNPIIAEQVRRGYFLDILGAIMPGIEAMFEHFLRRWAESNGKAIIILDGLIRRGVFTNKDGVTVPSQLEQLSVGLQNVIKKLTQEDTSLIRYFPEFNDPIANEEELTSIFKHVLKDATHIVTDVLPEDAEVQLKKRADKEMGSIRLRLQDRSNRRQLDERQEAIVEDCISRLEAILHGGIRRETDRLAYTPRQEWNNNISEDLYPFVAEEVKRVRESLAHTVGLKESAPLAESLESIGIFTELRDDDISPIARQGRLGNYIKRIEKEGKVLFESGLATQALCEDLGFQFTPDGSFKSKARNCIIIANGQSRDIGLEQFQSTCEFLAGHLYRGTESRREIKFAGKEGQKISREREI